MKTWLAMAVGDIFKLDGNVYRKISPTAYMDLSNPVFGEYSIDPRLAEKLDKQAEAAALDTAKAAVKPLKFNGKMNKVLERLAGKSRPKRKTAKKAEAKKPTRKTAAKKPAKKAKRLSAKVKKVLAAQQKRTPSKRMTAQRVDSPSGIDCTARVVKGEDY